MITRASDSPYSTFVHVRRCSFLKTPTDIFRETVIDIYLRLWCEWHHLWSSALVQCTTYTQWPYRAICRNWVVATPFTKARAPNFPQPSLFPLALCLACFTHWWCLALEGISVRTPDLRFIVICGEVKGFPPRSLSEWVWIKTRPLVSCLCRAGLFLSSCQASGDGLRLLDCLWFRCLWKGWIVMLRLLCGSRKRDRTTYKQAGTSVASAAAEN